MNKPDQIQEIKMQIVRIQEMNFALDECIWSLQEIDRDKLNVKMGFKFHPNINEESLSISVRVYYNYDIEGETRKIMSIEIVSLFKIVDIDKHIELGETKFNDKSNIIPSLLNIAFGSTRGYLAAKVAGTILAKYPLPLMDADSILSKIHSKKRESE